MTELNNFFSFFLTKKAIKKIIAYIVLILFIYIFKDFVPMFFGIFVFSYLFYALAKFIQEKWIALAMKNKNFKFLKKISLSVIIALEYLIFIFIITMIISWMLPKLIIELKDLAQTIPLLNTKLNQVTSFLEELKNINLEIWTTLNTVISSKDYQLLLNIFNQVKIFSLAFLQIILAFVLSFVFVIDRKKLGKYLAWVKSSNFSFFYEEYAIIFEKVVKSFGLIFKAQAQIAFANTVLTLIWLYAIGIVYWGIFPYILTLAIVVFVFGFIPVLWTILSSIPIMIIAFSFYWTISAVLMVLMLIAIIHMIEAYYLNPKIVSTHLEIPVSLTFIILIVSEHFFWIAWLLIWVSLFYFLVWLVKDFNTMLDKKSKKK